MPEVEMPDGSIAEFPDGMSEGDIQAAIEQHMTPKAGLAGNATGAFLNGMALGFGPAAVEGSTAEAIAANPALAAEVNPQQAGADFRASLDAYRKAHPLASDLASAAGSTLTTVPILGGVNIAEQAALKGLPAVANFVKGTAPGLLRFPSLALSGAKTGAEAAAIGSGTSDQPLDKQLETGAAIGAGGNLLAPFLRYVATPIGKAIDPMVQSAVDEARKLGLKLNLTQYAEGVPKVLKTGTTQDQMTTVNQLVNKEMGATGDTVTPESVVAARKDISQKFKNLESQIQIDSRDAGLNSAVTDAENYILQKYPRGGANAKQIQDTIDEIKGDIQDAHGRTVNPVPPGGTNLLAPPGGANPPAGMQGVIPGIRYFALTERGGPVDQLIKNPATNEVGVKLRQALDAGVDASSNPDVLPALRDARNQWKASLVAEELAGKGETSLHGQIDPTKLKDAVKHVYGMYGWGPDGTDLATIGDVGRLLNKPEATGHGGGGHWPFIGKLGIGYGAFEALRELGSLEPAHAAMIAGTGAGMLAGRSAMRTYLNSPLYRQMLANPATPMADPLTAFLTQSANSRQP